MYNNDPGLRMVAAAEPPQSGGRNKDAVFLDLP